jgi:hypothetical protein
MNSTMDSRSKVLSKGTRVVMKDNSGLRWVTLNRWVDAWQFQGFIPNRVQGAYQYKRWSLVRKRAHFNYSKAKKKPLTFRWMVSYPGGFKRADGLRVRKAQREAIVVKKSAHGNQRSPARKRCKVSMPLERPKQARLLTSNRY